MKAKRLKAAAASLLSSKVYLPLFLEKLASYGIYVRNEKELAHYLMLSHQLRQQLQNRFGFVDLQPTPIEKAAARIFAQNNPHLLNAAGILLRNS